MKKSKKILVAMLAGLMIGAGAMGLVACQTGNNSSSAPTEQSQFRDVYDMYVVYAEAQGIEPVSYEEWLESIKGEKGDKGDQGIQGDKGDQGEQGIQGEKGDKGDQGEQGIQGEKGDKGDQGEQGIQGEKGDKGDQGEKGDKGDQGVGIEKVEFDENGNLVITFTDGTKQTVEMPKKEDEDNSSANIPNNPSDESTEKKSQYIHFSFDDVTASMKNLKNNSYDSLFEEPFLGQLKKYHDEYDAKFSLYVFANSLQNQTTAYQEEFKANSDWLKIGLHADYGGMNYSSFTYDSAVTSWTTFTTDVLTLTGSMDCVDVIPRLHNFAGTEAALNAMCDYGAKGFLSADDSRLSYYLDSTASTYLKNNDYIKDSSNGLLFLKTDFRCEWIATSSGSSTHDNMYDELTYRYNTEKYKNAYESIIVFTHESYVYDGTALKDTISLVEDTCRFAKDNNISFDFPQNRAYAPTEHDIEGEFEKEPEISPTAITVPLTGGDLKLQADKRKIRYFFIK